MPLATYLILRIREPLQTGVEPGLAYEAQVGLGRLWAGNLSAYSLHDLAVLIGLRGEA